MEQIIVSTGEGAVYETQFSFISRPIMSTRQDRIHQQLPNGLSEDFDERSDGPNMANRRPFRFRERDEEEATRQAKRSVCNRFV